MEISKKQLKDYRKQENEQDTADAEYSASVHNLLSEVFGHFGQMYKNEDINEINNEPTRKKRK